MLLIGALLFAGLPSAQAKVWEATQTWDERWEEQYPGWIKTQFNDDVFIRGPYAGISTDCADAVYAARIIFSYENWLPFVVRGETMVGAFQMSR